MSDNDDLEESAFLNQPRPSTSGSSQAPEVVIDASAPERYDLVDGLQQIYGDAPEVVLDISLPLLHPDDAFPKEALGEITLQTPLRRWQTCSLFITVAGILAISLGFILSTGFRKSRDDIALPESFVTPVLSPTSPKSVILNDTSLAAISLPYGGRHVFFQAVDGSIRHTVFSAVTNSWNFDTYYVSTQAQPRNNTPLTVIPNPVFFDFFLFYVDTQNQLALVKVCYEGPACGENLIGRSFSVSPNSRSLSASQVFEAEWPIAVVLFFEDLHDVVTVMKLTYQHRQQGLPGTWDNVTDAFSNSVQSLDEGLAAPLGAPFAADPWHPGAYFFDSQALLDSAKAMLRYIKFPTIKTGQRPVSNGTATANMRLANPTLSMITTVRESDWVPCWICRGHGCGLLGPCWVLNQTLQLKIPGPSTVFPFRRLAFADSYTTSVMYIYHQSDGRVLMEEAYDQFANWITSNITVPLE